MMRTFVCLAFLIFAKSTSGSGVRANIIGGETVELDKYPEAVYITNGTSGCSATLIGPRVILTAAHCVDDGRKITPKYFETNGYSYEATCTISDKYHSQDHDIALCYTNEDVNVEWASIAGKGQGPKLYGFVTHVGFGCTKEDGTGGNNGQLKEGSSQVYKLADSGEHSWYSIGDGVCYGDSGGGTYRYIEDPYFEHHYILGVNSKGNIRNINLVADITSDESYRFIEEWVKLYDARICGYNKWCE